MRSDRNDVLPDSLLAIDEWEQIVEDDQESLQTEAEIRAREQEWLRKYFELPCAGAALERLLFKSANIKQQSARVIRQAQEWIELHPTHESVPLLVGSMVGQKKLSNHVLRVATRCLQDAEQNYFEEWYHEQESNRATGRSSSETQCQINGRGIASLVKNLLTHHPDLDLVDLIERYVDKYYSHPFWKIVFGIRTNHKPNPRVEKLTAQWLRLNVMNQYLHLVSLCTSTPSVEVAQACFEWIQNRGKSNRYMVSVLAEVLCVSRSSEELLLAVADFSRRWLKKNHNHRDAGMLHGALMLATLSPDDAQDALSWLESHTENESTIFVISDLLELAYCTSAPPDPFILERAKILLRDQNTRKNFPRLLGAIIRVCADDETIMWAKETWRLNNGILIRLLETAPDHESVSMATESYETWVNTQFEPEMLQVLLKTAPSDRRIRRRAHYWTKHNQEDVRCYSIQKLLEEVH